MSIHAMANVWATSTQSGGNLLLLLALADYANDRGECWPSVETLARKARVTDRHARRILRELVDAGEIEIRTGAGMKGVNVYQIRGSAERGADKMTGGGADISSTKGLTFQTGGADAHVSQTIMNHQEPSSSGAADGAPDRVVDDKETDSAKDALQKEAAGFVDWFLELLGKTGARVPKVTDAMRDTWADAYCKLVRIDGRNKAEIVRVCRWAREDDFWRMNFLSPVKLRQKNKAAVFYFDVFANRINQNHETPKGSNSRRLGAHSNIDALEAFAERRRKLAAET